MITFRPILRSLLLAVVFLDLLGCQTPSRPAPATGATAPSAAAPADTMARSDGDRAKATIEQNSKANEGRRPPYQPPPERVVDQPPPARRR